MDSSNADGDLKRKGRDGKMRRAPKNRATDSTTDESTSEDSKDNGVDSDQQSVGITEPSQAQGDCNKPAKSFDPKAEWKIIREYLVREFDSWPETYRSIFTANLGTFVICLKEKEAAGQPSPN